jgi:predicted ATPase
MVPFRTLELRESRQDRRQGRTDFPFTLPIFAAFEALSFTHPVTFFVGENGCGKSTLLEIIGAGLRLSSLGQTAIDQHPLMATAREAVRAFRFVRSHPIKHGFYFRADDVTGFLQSVQQNDRAHQEIAAELASTVPEGWGRTRAVGMAEAQSAALKSRYGNDPFARSHGELYLDLFRSRITAPGLYLMDEPETPLSPTSQLALIALIQQAVDRGSQFIIATHSPILMALPGAEILDINTSPPLAVNWEEVEHVALTKAFLNHPEAFLKHLTD